MQAAYQKVRQALILVSLARNCIFFLFLLGIFYLLWMRCKRTTGLPPVFKSSVLIYSARWLKAVWEWSVLPKNNDPGRRARTQTTDMIPQGEKWSPKGKNDPPGGNSYVKRWLNPQSSAVPSCIWAPCTVNPTTKKKVILRPASEQFLGSQKCLVVLNLFPALGAINHGLTERSLHVRRSSTRHCSTSFGNFRIRDR